ncbi:hypothetical protein [Planococcus wigleyi]|uniref:Uncharacterized protein n=1 Tax=Planococcus wigleyi TaxID=2762216 RepID=A0ABR8WA71_9BACL|nr:hypothetical protein [Planococcus wigleyi]MBD8013867.1 hypothetical protein [Planococcus wigleyi]
MTEETRQDMIQTMSIMLCKDEAYYQDMDDRRIIEEYDRFMKVNEG